MRRATPIAIAMECYFRLKFSYAPLEALNSCGLTCRSMPIPLQYGSQRGCRAGQHGHCLVVPVFRFRLLFPTQALCFSPILSAVAAAVSPIKVVSQQLRRSTDGQHNGNVRCAFKVL